MQELIPGNCINCAAGGGGTFLQYIDTIGIDFASYWLKGTAKKMALPFTAQS